jgi:aspartate-semialdehyde dehydrogenase
MSYRVAVLGATGLVGRRFLEILDQRVFPFGELLALASERSAGTTVRCGDALLPVRRAEPSAFEGVDLVLSSAGAAVSRELLPAAVQRGAVAVDNTSAFRMDPGVPLVVPEVNSHRIADHRGIIANPNCSTIQLVVALKPLHDAFGVRRVVVSTYQSVSGAGQAAVEELHLGLGSTDRSAIIDRPLSSSSVAFNAVPHIDVFRDGGDTKEEWKMRVETPKIMEAPIELHATCVRVPVVHSHSEAVWIETERPADPEAARALLRASSCSTIRRPLAIRPVTTPPAATRSGSAGCGATPPPPTPSPCGWSPTTCARAPP